MISEIIDKIKEAEFEAEKILDAARVQVQKIEKQSQIDIEELKSTSVEETAAQVRKIASGFQNKNAAAKVEPLNVSKANMEAAKKLIIAEFNKRFVA